MKKVYKDKIINIPNTDLFDNKFLFEFLETDYRAKNIEVFYMSELLKKKENTELLNNLNWKWAIYSEVYSPKEEFEIFEELFNYAILNNKKIHIVWITLKQELDILEKYYTEKWYLREDVNCFIPNFWEVLVTVSVNIENLIWRWSDYKANWKSIFFIPPVRESGQNKAMFKWINRWSIAGIFISWKSGSEEVLGLDFLEKCIQEEKILPLTLAKVLNYNLKEIWFNWKEKKVEIKFEK